MAPIHERIEEVLAAAVHDELSDAERYELHVHLVECAECRGLHKEDQLMNRAMEEVFTQEKPDFGFEKRLLYAFRQRAPHRETFTALWGNILRSRAVQFASLAALLLGLIQLGRVLVVDRTEPNVSNWSPPTLASLEANDVPAESRIAAAEVKSEPAGNRADASDATAAAEEKSTALAAPSLRAAQTSLPAKAPLMDQSAASVMKDAPATVSGSADPASSATALPDRKLVRNAAVQLEVENFEESLQKITGLVTEGQGYVASTASDKQENGKLRGRVVVKVLPEKLDSFLEQLRGLGDVKNQTLGTEDVTKLYVDRQAHLSNSQAMEQRLLEILKKKSDDISDLLAVEKELGRVRQEIEQIQGELKLMDSQVQFATVTITLSEKNMEEPAGFLIKERAQLALYASDVEKVYETIKAFASPTVQITNATLERDGGGHVSAHIQMLIAPEESDSVLARAKTQARVANFQVQSDRIARGGKGMSEDAKTERDKTELNIIITPEAQEAALQQTTLSLRTDHVTESVKRVRELVEKQSGRLQSSSFSRDPNGREYSQVSARVPLKNYSALMQALGAIGKAENVSVHRQERPNADEPNAPADINMQVYSPGNIVANQTSIAATLRRTLAQGSAALMWSVQMIGVALAFLLPWLLPIALGVWLTRRMLRARAANRDRAL